LVRAHIHFRTQRRFFLHTLQRQADGIEGLADIVVEFPTQTNAFSDGLTQEVATDLQILLGTRAGGMFFGEGGGAFVGDAGELFKAGGLGAALGPRGAGYGVVGGATACFQQHKRWRPKCAGAGSGPATSPGSES
jgi:hypothetical protein